MNKPMLARRHAWALFRLVLPTLTIVAATGLLTAAAAATPDTKVSPQLSQLWQAFVYWAAPSWSNPTSAALSGSFAASLVRWLYVKDKEKEHRNDAPVEGVAKSAHRTAALLDVINCLLGAILGVLLWQAWHSPGAMSW
jgi:hypothetical protein